MNKKLNRWRNQAIILINAVPKTSLSLFSKTANEIHRVQVIPLKLFIQ
jgi:hypothetical protein